MISTRSAIVGCAAITSRNFAHFGGGAGVGHVSGDQNEVERGLCMEHLQFAHAGFESFIAARARSPLSMRKP